MQTFFSIFIITIFLSCSSTKENKQEKPAVSFPPNFNNPDVPKPHDLDLTRHPFSMKDYVRSITDSIIYSKDLK